MSKDAWVEGDGSRCVLVNNRMLRRWSVTGSCATGASKAAAALLFMGQKALNTGMATPNGTIPKLHVGGMRIDGDSVAYAMRGYGWDDLDATSRTLVHSTFSKRAEASIHAARWKDTRTDAMTCSSKFGEMGGMWHAQEPMENLKGQVLR